MLNAATLRELKKNLGERYQVQLVEVVGAMTTKFRDLTNYIERVDQMAEASGSLQVKVAHQVVPRLDALQYV